MMITANDIRNFVGSLDDSKDFRKSLVTKFPAKTDQEIAAIIVSWMNNGISSEEYTIRKTLDDMTPSPTAFVLKPHDDDLPYDNGCFCGVLSNANFVNLIRKIQECHIYDGGIKESFTKKLYTRRNKCRYAHEALSDMLSGNTGFPTRTSIGTFFRLNYLYYLLYRLGIWQDMDLCHALLPCNDTTMQMAYKHGITRKKLNSDLFSTKQLTNVAKEMFGEKDFYLLYEFLNFAP